MFNFADGNDKLLFVIGSIFGVLTGLGIPLFMYYFGDIIYAFTFEKEPLNVSDYSLDLIIIGSILFMTAYVHYLMLDIVATRIVSRTRVAFFKAIL
jgi:hypothetical protein